MENFQAKHVKQISFLGQFVGSVMITYSLFITLQGLLPYLIGAVPGLIGVYIGKLFYDTGSEGKELLRYKGKNFVAVNVILEKMGILLMITGILLFIFIISMAIIIAGLIYKF